MGLLHRRSIRGIAVEPHEFAQDQRDLALPPKTGLLVIKPGGRDQAPADLVVLVAGVHEADVDVEASGVVGVGAGLDLHGRSSRPAAFPDPGDNGFAHPRKRFSVPKGRWDLPPPYPMPQGLLTYTQEFGQIAHAHDGR
jgi:hypothetical protein